MAQTTHTTAVLAVMEAVAAALHTAQQDHQELQVKVTLVVLTQTVLAAAAALALKVVMAQELAVAATVEQDQTPIQHGQPQHQPEQVGITPVEVALEIIHQEQLTMALAALAAAVVVEVVEQDRQ